jgi:hypothetical protein
MSALMTDVVFRLVINRWEPYALGDLSLNKQGILFIKIHKDLMPQEQEGCHLKKSSRG